MTDDNNQENEALPVELPADSPAELTPELTPEQKAELQGVVLGNLMLTAGILIGLSLEKTDNPFVSAIIAVQELDEDDLQEIMQSIINFFNTESD
jgi:hypothetical protein